MANRLKRKLAPLGRGTERQALPAGAGAAHGATAHGHRRGPHSGRCAPRGSRIPARVWGRWPERHPTAACRAPRAGGETSDRWHLHRKHCACFWDGTDCEHNDSRQREGWTEQAPSSPCPGQRGTRSLLKSLGGSQGSERKGPNESPVRTTTRQQNTTGCKWKQARKGRVRKGLACLVFTFHRHPKSTRLWGKRSAARCSSCGAMSHRHRTNSPGRAAVPPQSFLRSTDQRAPGWLLAVQPALQERAWRRCMEGVGPEILLYKSMVTH